MSRIDQYNVKASPIGTDQVLVIDRADPVNPMTKIANLSTMPDALGLGTTASPTFAGATLTGALTGMEATLSRLKILNAKALAVVAGALDTTLNLEETVSGVQTAIRFGGKAANGGVGNMGMIVWSAGSTGAAGDNSLSFYAESQNNLVAGITILGTGDTTLGNTLTLSSAVTPRINGSTTLGYLDLFGDGQATSGVRLLDTGALLINTTTPIGTEKLRVNGGVYIDDSVTTKSANVKESYTATLNVSNSTTWVTVASAIGGNASYLVSARIAGGVATAIIAQEGVTGLSSATITTDGIALDIRISATDLQVRSVNPGSESAAVSLSVIKMSA